MIQKMNPKYMGWRNLENKPVVIKWSMFSTPLNWIKAPNARPNPIIQAPSPIECSVPDKTKRFGSEEHMMGQLTNIRHIATNTTANTSGLSVFALPAFFSNS
jgi:hypothetical protein